MKWSRLRQASRTTSLKVTSAALAIATVSARPAALSGSRERLEQHREVGALHHLGLVAVVEHGEARRHIGLERKLLQQPGAQRVDGLHLQPARRLQRGGEQFAGAHAQRASTRAMPASRIAASSASSSSVTQWPRVENTRSAMLAAAALVKVMQRIFSGGTLSSKQPDHPLHQHMGLARAGIGRDEGRRRRVGRARLRGADGRRNGARRGHHSSIPRPPAADHSLMRARSS